MYDMLVGELLKKRHIVRARRTRQWEEHWNRNQENQGMYLTCPKTVQPVSTPFTSIDKMTSEQGNGTSQFGPELMPAVPGT